TDRAPVFFSQAPNCSRSDSYASRVCSDTFLPWSRCARKSARRSTDGALLLARDRDDRGLRGGEPVLHRGADLVLGHAIDAGAVILGTLVPGERRAHPCELEVRVGPDLRDVWRIGDLSGDDAREVADASLVRLEAGDRGFGRRGLVEDLPDLGGE